MIKLLKVEDLEDGTERFKTQLEVFFSTGTVSFIRKNGIMQQYRHGDKGERFYPFNEPYEIVYNKEEMKHQQV